MKKLTIADVAKKANVSVSTVSRVISNSKSISENTKKNVRKIIEELNFIPNSSAQNLTKHETRIIGIVLNTKDVEPLANNFFSKILEHISEYLIKKNYYSIYIHCDSFEDENMYIRSLVGSRRVDGLIFLRAYSDESIFDYLNNIVFPFVIIGRPKDEKKYFWVDNNNYEASYEITKKLIEKNCNKFCFFGGSFDLNVTKARYRGYEKALKENNKDSIAEIESTFDLNKAYKVVEKLLKTNKDIDAIVTTDDILAIASKRMIEKLKYKNILVSGFNDTELRKFANYKFLTVNIDIKKLADKACELVLSNIKNKKLNKNYMIINTKIVEEK